MSSFLGEVRRGSNIDGTWELDPDGFEQRTSLLPEGCGWGSVDDAPGVGEFGVGFAEGEFLTTVHGEWTDENFHVELGRRRQT